MAVERVAGMSTVTASLLMGLLFLDLVDLVVLPKLQAILTGSRSGPETDEGKSPGPPKPPIPPAPPTLPGQIEEAGS